MVVKSYSANSNSPKTPFKTYYSREVRIPAEAEKSVKDVRNCPKEIIAGAMGKSIGGPTKEPTFKGYVLMPDMSGIYTRATPPFISHVITVFTE